MSSNKNTCEDFQCEWNGEGEHTHVGVQPYLRRVIDSNGVLVDGKTREPIIESKAEVKIKMR